MKVLLVCFSIVFLGCQSKSDKSVFDHLKGQTDIVISLKAYQLDSVPPAINVLQGVERLTILKDSAMSWIAYPPLSALGEQPKLDTTFRHLPKEITELGSLKRLTLFNLDLVSLPDDVYKLKNLDTLDLTLNKLVISQEIDKLKKLTHLKFLNVGGNRAKKDDIVRLQSAMPATKIFPDTTLYSGLKRE